MRLYCVNPTLPTKAVLRIREAPSSTANIVTTITNGKAIQVLSPMFTLNTENEMIFDTNINTPSWLHVIFSISPGKEIQGYIMARTIDGMNLLVPWEETNYLSCGRIHNAQLSMYEQANLNTKIPDIHIEEGEGMQFFYGIKAQENSYFQIFHDIYEDVWIHESEIEILTKRLNHYDCRTPHALYTLNGALPKAAQIAIRSFPSQEAETFSLLNHSEIVDVCIMSGDWLQLTNTVPESWIKWKTDEWILLVDVPEETSQVCQKQGINSELEAEMNTKELELPFDGISNSNVSMSDSPFVSVGQKSRRSSLIDDNSMVQEEDKVQEMFDRIEKSSENEPKETDDMHNQCESMKRLSIGNSNDGQKNVALSKQQEEVVAGPERLANWEDRPLNVGNKNKMSEGIPDQSTSWEDRPLNVGNKNTMSETVTEQTPNWEDRPLNVGNKNPMNGAVSEQSTNWEDRPLNVVNKKKMSELEYPPCENSSDPSIINIVKQNIGKENSSDTVIHANVVKVDKYSDNQPTSDQETSEAERSQNSDYSEEKNLVSPHEGTSYPDWKSSYQRISRSCSAVGGHDSPPLKPAFKRRHSSINRRNEQEIFDALKEEFLRESYKSIERTSSRGFARTESSSFQEDLAGALLDLEAEELAEELDMDYDSMDVVTETGYVIHMEIENEWEGREWEAYQLLSSVPDGPQVLPVHEFPLLSTEEEEHVNLPTEGEMEALEKQKVDDIVQDKGPDHEVQDQSPDGVVPDKTSDEAVSDKSHDNEAIKDETNVDVPKAVEGGNVTESESKTDPAQEDIEKVKPENTNHLAKTGAASYMEGKQSGWKEEDARVFHAVMDTTDSDRVMSAFVSNNDTSGDWVKYTKPETYKSSILPPVVPPDTGFLDVLYARDQNPSRLSPNRQVRASTASVDDVARKERLATILSRSGEVEFQDNEGHEMYSLIMNEAAGERILEASIKNQDAYDCSLIGTYEYPTPSMESSISFASPGRLSQKQSFGNGIAYRANGTAGVGGRPQLQSRLSFTSPNHSAQQMHTLKRSASAIAKTPPMAQTLQQYPNAIERNSARDVPQVQRKLNFNGADIPPNQVSSRAALPPKRRTLSGVNPSQQRLSSSLGPRPSARTSNPQLPTPQRTSMLQRTSSNSSNSSTSSVRSRAVSHTQPPQTRPRMPSSSQPQTRTSSYQQTTRASTPSRTSTNVPSRTSTNVPSRTSSTLTSRTSSTLPSRTSSTLASRTSIATASSTSTATASRTRTASPSRTSTMSPPRMTSTSPPRPNTTAMPRTTTTSPSRTGTSRLVRPTTSIPTKTNSIPARRTNSFGYSSGIPR